MSPPKLSIVTICLNDPINLRKTLESCLPLVRSLGQEYEHIVVDSSPEVHFPVRNDARFSYIRWNEMQPKGIYAALNFGSRLCEGEIIWHLHAGDALKSSENLLKALDLFSQSSALELVYSPIDLTRHGQFMFTNYQFEYFPRNFYRFSALDHQGVLLKKNLLERMSFFSENYRLAADYDLWVRCLKVGIQSKYFPLPFVEFDTGGDSTRQGRLLCQEVAKIRKNLTLAPWGRSRNFFDFNYHRARILWIVPGLQKIGLYRLIRFLYIRFKRNQS